jgi:hypothetical protein
MTDSAHRVAIVVDPAFGARLDALAERLHVWVADTPTNRSAAERLWRLHPPTGTSRDLERGVTTFNVEPSHSPEQWCAAIVGTVDEHHGGFAHNPPVSELEVYGAPPTPEVRAAFAAYGFDEIAATPGGFRAKSRPALT